jgi:hypothetical protein
VVTSEKPKAVESEPEKLPSQQGTEESTSTITLEEHKKALADAVNAAKGEEGRKHKIALQAAEKRVKDQMESQLSKLQKQNEDLQSDLVELGADDEDKSRLAKLLKDNQKKADELENKIAAYAPKIAKAEEYELTEMCNEVSKDYENADAARLKRIVGRTKFSDDQDKLDQIREIAEDFGWQKKTETPPIKEQPRKVDSDVTTGTSKGKTPTLEQLKASPPEETEKKIKSGEWVLPGWMG